MGPELQDGGGPVHGPPAAYDGKAAEADEPVVPGYPGPAIEAYRTPHGGQTAPEG